MDLYWQIIVSLSFALSLGALSTAYFARVDARESVKALYKLSDVVVNMTEQLVDAQEKRPANGADVIEMRPTEDGK
jgi:hypothetical protein